MSYVRKTPAILFGLLILATPALAQGDDEGVSGWWTVFGAPGFTLGFDPFATLHVGGGGEFVWPNGLGVGADVGYISAGEFDAGVGIFSPGLIYQFRTESSYRPYLRGGYTLLFAEGTANLVHFGGGFNRWFNERWGIKFEVRDHFIVQASELHILEFHIGLVSKLR